MYFNCHFRSVTTFLCSECRRKIRKLREKERIGRVYVREESNKWRNYIVIWILAATYVLRKIFPAKGSSYFMCCNTKVQTRLHDPPIRSQLIGFGKDGLTRHPVTCLQGISQRISYVIFLSDSVGNLEWHFIVLTEEGKILNIY